MLMLKLIAQTGNNMFQYAACKTLAESKGYQLSFRGGRKGSLHRFFELDGETTFSLLVDQLLYRLRYLAGNVEFRPHKKYYNHEIFEECFDKQFFDIDDGVTVRGFLQSPEYFSHNRARVLQWFTLRACYGRMLNDIEALFPVPPDLRCCIHIRRSDYLEMEEKTDGIGWVLPMAYYKEALSRMPENLYYVIVSDDPQFASQIFSGIRNKFVAHGNPDVIDMFLFTRCKFNIIANSSFSWWGAWLNEISDKTIIAPKYHLGWSSYIWLPDKIKVDGWQYIDVMDAQVRHGAANIIL